MTPGYLPDLICSSSHGRKRRRPWCIFEFWSFSSRLPQFRPPSLSCVVWQVSNAHAYFFKSFLLSSFRLLTVFKECLCQQCLHRLQCCNLILLIRHACSIPVIINIRSKKFVTLKLIQLKIKKSGSEQGNNLPLAENGALCRRKHSQDVLAGHSFVFMLRTCSNRFLLFPKNLLEKFSGSGWPNHPPHLQFIGTFHSFFLSFFFPP